ncbi:MAG: hypothetical protein R2822_10240 [Spirosomataceae bacterium]
MAILDYPITQLKVPNHPGWSPYATNIYIHDNTYERTIGHTRYDTNFGKLMIPKKSDVVYDGIIDETQRHRPHQKPYEDLY